MGWSLEFMEDLLEIFLNFLAVLCLGDRAGRVGHRREYARSMAVGAVWSGAFALPGTENGRESSAVFAGPCRDRMGALLPGEGNAPAALMADRFRGFGRHLCRTFAEDPTCRAAGRRGGNPSGGCGCTGGSREFCLWLCRTGKRNCADYRAVFPLAVRLPVEKIFWELSGLCGYEQARHRSHAGEEHFFCRDAAGACLHRRQHSFALCVDAHPFAGQDRGSHRNAGRRVPSPFFRTADFPDRRGGKGKKPSNRPRGQAPISPV